MEPKAVSYVTVNYTVDGQKKSFKAQKGVLFGGGNGTKSQPKVSSTASKNINIGLISKEQAEIINTVKNYDGKPELTAEDTKLIYEKYCKTNGGEDKAFSRYGDTNPKGNSIFKNKDMKLVNSHPIPSFERHQVLIDYEKNGKPVTDMHIDFDPHMYDEWD